MDVGHPDQEPYEAEDLQDPARDEQVNVAGPFRCQGHCTVNDDRNGSPHLRDETKGQLLVRL